MADNKRSTTLTQKDYQRKYDEKTKTISIKYVLSDMKDYDRLMAYLKKTGQSTNGFIKRMINGFFENGYDRKIYPVPKEAEKGQYFKFDYIDDEFFEKLKNILGGDEEKYNIVLDYYADCIENELESALEGKAIAFEEWVEKFEESVNDGEININVEGRDFWKVIDRSVGTDIGEIIYD